MKCVSFALVALLATWAAHGYGAVEARYVTIDIPKETATLSLAEVEVIVNGKNVAPTGKATQSSTAHGGDAKRAIDGNNSGDWGKNSITHSEEGVDTPTWELDLGKDMPIDRVILWNRNGYESRLNGVRVALADANRKILWEEDRPQTGRQNFFVTEVPGKGPRVGQRCETIPERAERARIAALTKQININALRDGFKAYSEKYPEAYPNAKEIAAGIDALRKRIEAGESDPAKLLSDYRKLQKQVLLQHPAVDFDEIIFLSRERGSKQGLFANWQGNTGWVGNNNGSLRGYKGKLLRGPLDQDTAANREPTVLRSSSAYMGELCLNWDGKTLLMSSGEENEKDGNWGLYEIGVDGKDWRVAYKSDDKTVDFYDACYLPNGDIIAAATVGFQGVPCVGGNDIVANLCRISKDRKSVRRLTFDQDGNWNPEVYPNGRVVFLRWEYTDSAHYFSRVLMTMNPDGTDQQEFYGSGSYWPNSLFYHQNIPGSNTKFVGIVSGHHGVARKGEMVMFDVTKGRIETQGAVVKFAHAGKPIENITKDQLVNSARPYFLHPRPLNDEIVLAARQDQPSDNFRIVLQDIYDNCLTLWELPNENLYEPIPLKKPAMPATRTDNIVPDSKTCNVYMANVYRGQNTLKDVPKGTVKKLRVFHYEYAPRYTGGHYAIGMEGPWDPRVLHGTVDVEDDGSCMFKFPAQTPLSVQPLDSEGRALQVMRSWLVGQPGETISCIGCHENQNAAAPSGQVTVASRKPPQTIKPWYGPARGWAFEREFQPVLDAKCVGCHNGETTATNAMGEKIPNFAYNPKPGWSKFSESYLALHPYVRRNGPEGDYHILNPLEFHVSTSDLYQILKKGHHGVVLTPEEWDRLITWVDLNVPYWGTWTEHGTRKNIIDQRRRYEKETSNLDFDPERVINPYKPGATKYQAPTGKTVAKGPAPKLDGWPFDGAAKQGKRETITLDVGGDQTITLVKIPAGKFVMGSNDETNAEAPAHVASVDKPFYMGTTEVTMAMMQQFDPTFENGVLDKHYKDQVNRGYFMNEPNFPAMRVSYDQAQAFCAWLSKKTGKKVRLPTETEWEYACRAGTDTPMNYGDFNADFGKKANLADVTMKELAVHGVDPKPIRNPNQWMDYEKKDARYNDGVLHLANVGSYAPNAFGLHDMHGNVAEWTSSPFVSYEGGPGFEGADPALKVIRGGSWYQRPIRASSANRWGYSPWQHPYNVGFRVVVEE